MYNVFLTAFKPEYTLERNTKRSVDLAMDLINKQHAVSVASLFDVNPDTQHVTHRQAYVVTVPTWADVTALADLSRIQYGQPDVLVVDVLAGNLVTYIEADGVNSTEGVLKPCVDTKGSYILWRDRVWTIQ